MLSFIFSGLINLIVCSSLSKTALLDENAH